MKLKFYLIGFGMGALLATAILIISGGLNKTDMTDDEIMARARQLGMVESSSRLIDQNTQGTANAEISGSSITAQANSGSQKSEDAQTSASDVSSADASENASAGEKEESGVSETGSEDTGSNQGQSGTPGTGIIGEENAQAGASQSAEAGNSKSEAAADAGENTGANAQGGQVIVTIPDGLYSEGVSELLQQAGAVDDATAFNAYLIQSGRDRYITPGAKLIPAAATYEDVAKILSGR